MGLDWGFENCRGRDTEFFSLGFKHKPLPLSISLLLLNNKINNKYIIFYSILLLKVNFLFFYF